MWGFRHGGTCPTSLLCELGILAVLRRRTMTTHCPVATWDMLQCLHNQPAGKHLQPVEVEILNCQDDYRMACTHARKEARLQIQDPQNCNPSKPMDQWTSDGHQFLASESLSTSLTSFERAILSRDHWTCPCKVHGRILITN